MELTGSHSEKISKSSQVRVYGESQKEWFSNHIMSCKDSLFRIAQSILRNTDDAQDAVSQAILRAYAQLGSLKNKDSFIPWIMKIVVNESYAIAKKRKKVIYLEDAKPIEQGACDSSYALWDIVCNMEDKFRIVIVLFYYEDMELKEIAKVLGLPMGTVKSRLSRARQKLKSILQKEE